MKLPVRLAECDTCGGRLDTFERANGQRLFKRGHTVPKKGQWATAKAFARPRCYGKPKQ